MYFFNFLEKVRKFQNNGKSHAKSLKALFFRYTEQIWFGHFSGTFPNLSVFPTFYTFSIDLI